MKAFSRELSHTAAIAASTTMVLSSAAIRTGACILYRLTSGSMPPAANAPMPSDVATSISGSTAMDTCRHEARCGDTREGAMWNLNTAGLADDGWSAPPRAAHPAVPSLHRLVVN